jgi:hypothetical protein
LATLRYIPRFGIYDKSPINGVNRHPPSVIKRSDKDSENAYTKIHFISAEKGLYALSG